MNKSIGKRLLYSFTAISVVVLICVSFGLSYIINDYFWGSRRRELLSDGKQIANVIMTRFELYDREGISQYLRSVDHFLRARVWFVDKDKKIIASSWPLPAPQERNEHGGMHGGERKRFKKMEINMDVQRENATKAYKEASEQIRGLIDEVLVGEAKTIRAFHPYFEDNVIAIGIPVKDFDGRVVGALLLTAPVRNTQNFLANIYYYIAGVGILAILLSWGLTKFLSKRLVQPLIDMRESAAAMAKGDYSGRVNVKGHDEVADLGHSLNLLAEDLADFVDKMTRMEQLRRDFVANVSHELRTPITVIRGYNEAMLDGTVTDPEKIERYRTMIREETIRLEGLVRELLDISRLQARTETSYEKVPLDKIVKEIAEKLTVKADEREVKITVVTEENSFVNAVGDRLVQLVVILADNAIKYSKQGGNVLLKVEKTPDKKIVLIVQDDGIGIEEKEQPLIWERFYKVDKSHNKAAGGTGLGLAIAKEIIDMHKAQVVLDSKLGRGTTIKIFFNFAN